MTGPRPPDSSERVDRTRSTAWVSLAAVVAAVVLGRWASSTLLEARGYDPVVDTEPPGLGLAAYCLAAVIVLPAVALALHNGLRARRAGHPDAAVVVVVAGLVGVVVGLGFPLYLSRIIGWPWALAVGALIVLAAWLAETGAGRHRRRPGRASTG